MVVCIFIQYIEQGRCVREVRELICAHLNILYALWEHTASFVFTQPSHTDLNIPDSYYQTNSWDGFEREKKGSIYDTGQGEATACDVYVPLDTC